MKLELQNRLQYINIHEKFSSEKLINSVFLKDRLQGPFQS